MYKCIKKNVIASPDLSGRGNLIFCPAVLPSNVVVGGYCVVVFLF